MNPAEAERLQNKIYKRMSASKKIKIAGELFLLGKKLDSLKKQKNNDGRKTSLQNNKNLK